MAYLVVSSALLSRPDYIPMLHRSKVIGEGQGLLARHGAARPP